MSAIDNLKDAVSGIVDNWPVIHKFANGSETETVETDAGTLPVIAKVVADAQNTFEQAKTDLIAQKGDEINQAANGVLAQAQAAAGTAGDQAGAAQAAASAADGHSADAQGFATQAQAARDAALIQGGVYVSEPVGRAAVADGQAFKVQGDGVSVAAYEYRRVNAGTVSTLIATYPAASAVSSNRVTSGELFPALSMMGQALNGAAFVTDTGGRPIGFSIPAASTGLSSWVAGTTNLSANDLAALVGLYIVSVYTATANFLTDKPTNTSAVRVSLAAGGTATRGNVLSNVQNGTTITRTVSYVVQGDEAAIGTMLQLNGNVAANNAHSVQLRSQVFYVQPVTATPSLATTPADLMADFRSRLTAIATAAQIAAATAPFTTFAQTQAVLGVTSGEQFASLTMSGQNVAGASFINDAAARTVGYTIPAASTGAASWVAGVSTMSAADLAAFAGQTLYFVAVYTATANFLTEKPLNTLAVRIALTAGGTANRGTHVSTTQNGTTITRIVSYVVQGDEAAIGVMCQVNASAVANNSHSIQLRSQVFYVQANAATPGADTLADKMADWRLRRVGGNTATTPFRFTSSKADLATAPQVFNGATIRHDSNGIGWGWTIPAGQTGQTTLNLTGRVLRFTLGCDTSANYSRNVGIAAQTVPAAGGTRGVAATTVKNAQISASRRQIIFTMPLTGDEITVQPYIRCPDSVTTAGDEWLLVTDLMVEILTTTSDTLTPADENARVFRDMLMQAVTAQIATAMAGVPSNSYARTVKVKADGTGDFTTIKAAALSITDASATKRYEIQIYDAHTVITDITQANWQLPGYVDVRYVGVGLGWIEYHFPANTAPADTVNTSGFWVNGTSKLTNLKVTMQNGRYPVHSDGSGANPNIAVSGVDCWFEHMGCQEAIDYQTSLGAGGNPSGVWRSWSPFGYGSASGHVMEFYRCTFLSQDRGGYIHTNQNFTAPTVLRFHKCRLIARNPDGHSMLIQPLGSGQRDVVELDGCQLQGDVWITPSPWIPTGSYQPADRSEIAVYMNGCTPVAFNYTDTALALSVVATDTTTAASVVASGTAAGALFGTPTSLGGGGGLPAQLIGSIDVSGTGVGLAQNVFVTSMGYRLGDCSSVNKTLSLTFNGGQVANVTFNQNYTNVDNATILALINSAIQTAFGNAGLTLASLISVFATTRPYVLDQELYLQNTSTVGLVVGCGVRNDTTDLSMVPMSSTDAASLFVGVTLERILPGAWGRVRKARGQQFRTTREIARTDSAGLVRGDTLGIGATPGQFVKGAATPLLVAINVNKVTSI
jgi:hypothetical protein